MNKPDSSSELLRAKALSFFEMLGMQVRVFGKERSKFSFIYKDNYSLPCFITSAGKLIVMDKVHNGQQVAEFDMNSKVASKSRRASLIRILDTLALTELYKLRLKGTDLFLAGFGNTIQPDGTRLKHPVFARKSVNVYYNPEMAAEVRQQYSDEYDLEIVVGKTVYN